MNGMRTTHREIPEEQALGGPKDLVSPEMVGVMGAKVEGGLVGAEAEGEGGLVGAEVEGGLDAGRLVSPQCF